MSVTEEITVGIGTEFRWVIADGNCLWRVTGKAGPNVWHAEVQPEWTEIRGERMMVSDYAGTTDVFTTERIAGSLNMDRVFERLANDSDFFWEDRVEGAIVHYHNSFGRYVRGRIVIEDGRKVMLPIALVGAWKPSDLVSWTAWGEVSKGYHVRQIEEGETMRPHASNIYECPGFSGPRGEAAEINPREAKALDLTPPERTPDDIDFHDSVARWRDLRNILGDETPRTTEEAEERIVTLKVRMGWE